MLKIGMVVDNRYKILREIGRGGTSCVYLAENMRLHNYCAIKEVYKGGIIGEDASGDMLIAESSLLTKLRHPGLPVIFDILNTSDACLVVMEYIEGVSLDKVLMKQGVCSEEDVVKWGKQLCNVLSYLHSQHPPIIYRDMKPGNIMLRSDGSIVLIDFGLARVYKRQSQHDTSYLGTHGYAAPEQYDNTRQTDARTDIYSLGVTLYHLVTGHDPCKPPYGIDSIRAHNPALSGQLDAIIQKCICLEPEDRFQSAAALNSALETIGDAEGVTTVLCEKPKEKKRNKWIWPLALVIVGIAIIALLLFFGGQRGSATNAATNSAGDAVMSYAEFAAAPVDSEVVIETYIQATQSRWEDKVIAWCQSPEGACYVYGMQCTKEDAEKLIPGTKVRITGKKMQSSGALEIWDATFEFVKGNTFVSKALNVTNLLGTNELSKHQNAKVAFKGMTVEKIAYQNEESGKNIYLTLSRNGKSYDFCIEAELTGPDTEVYKLAGKLKTGNIIDVEGFLYWSNGPIPRITAITNIAKPAGAVMSYAEFAAAPVDSEVVIETYIQATQGRWEDKVIAWCQSPDGAYYVYGMQCTKENAKKLVPGTKVRIKGQKKQYSGAVEIYFATFEFVKGDSFVSQALDVTNLLGTEELSKHQNAKVAFIGMTVEKIARQDKDIYVTLRGNGKSYEFCVEAELTGSDTAVYKDAEKLKVGDVIDVEGFLYWSNGPIPRITHIAHR